MDIGEVVVVAFGLLVAFGVGAIVSFALTARFFLELIKATKGVLGGKGGGKTGWLDVGLAFLKGDLKLDKIFGGKG